MLQRHPGNSSMVLVQKQTHNSVNCAEIPDRRWHTTTWVFQVSPNKEHLQQVALGKLDIYLCKNEMYPTTELVHRSITYRSKKVGCKTWSYLKKEKGIVHFQILAKLRIFWKRLLCQKKQQKEDKSLIYFGAGRPSDNFCNMLRKLTDNALDVRLRINSGKLKWYPAPYKQKWGKLCFLWKEKMEERLKVRYLN